MRLLDSEEAAAACGMGAWSVRKAVRDGLLTNYGSGRGYRLELDEVLQVMGDPYSLLP